jgi:hypothetical protein
VTVNKDGILISKDGKEGTDLIDEALKYNGQLPEKRTPDAPTQRSPRATAPAPAATANGPSAPAAIKP